MYLNLHLEHKEIKGNYNRKKYTHKELSKVIIKPDFLTDEL